MHEVWNGTEVCEQNIGTKLRLPMKAVFNLHLCIKQFSNKGKCSVQSYERCTSCTFYYSYHLELVNSAMNLLGSINSGEVFTS